MKPIDAEKLKAEIERLKAKYRKDMYKSSYEGLASGYKIEAYNELLLSLDSLQQEQPSEICSKCIHHGKDDGYCYNPHRGMQSLINENGVYECTGFCEQEHHEVDLEKFTEKMDAWKARYSSPDDVPIKGTMAFTARMFYMYPKVAREWYDSLPKVTLD